MAGVHGLPSPAFEHPSDRRAPRLPGAKGQVRTRAAAAGPGLNPCRLGGEDRADDELCRLLIGISGRRGDVRLGAESLAQLVVGAGHVARKRVPAARFVAGEVAAGLRPAGLKPCRHEHEDGREERHGSTSTVTADARDADRCT